MEHNEAHWMTVIHGIFPTNVDSIINENMHSLDRLGSA